MKKLSFNQPAKDLAKDLLGKVICYDGKQYMITITEAYPFNDDDNYVNRYGAGSKGHDLLVGNDRLGTCFVYAGMLHFVALGGEYKNEYRYGNVIIRGGIEVDKKGKILKGKDRKLYFKSGRPYKLCSNVLSMPKDYNEQATSIINNEKTYDIDLKNDIEIERSIGLDSEEKLKYSVTKCAIERLIGD